MTGTSFNVSSDTGLRPSLRATLLCGIGAIALSGCSTWSSVLETVFGAPEEVGPAVVQTAEVTAVKELPMTWEPGEQKPVTWVSATPADVVAEVTVADIDDDDDVMAQIAEAAVLEGEDADGVVQMADAGELSELRGGFVTRFGIISIGFDVKTFVDGVLQVQNIFNLVGNIQDLGGADGNPATDDGPPVTPLQLVTITNNPGGGPPKVSQSTPPPAPAPQQASAPPPAPQQQASAPSVPKTTINNVSNGGIEVKNELNDGKTEVINKVKNGAVQSVLINEAHHINIEQVTSLVIGVSDPSGFIRQIRSGVKTGNKDRLVSGFRASLFGAISR